MKNYLVGFSIAIVAAGLFYFFHLLPLKDKAYLDGYNDAVEDIERNIDTVFLPSEPIIRYEEKTIFVEKPAEVSKLDDSTYLTATSIDSTFTFGEDTIGVAATVGLEFNINNILEPAAEWFMTVTHKELECIPDTVVMKIPKIIKEVEYETNWLYIFISFISGGGIMALLALL